MLEQDLVNSTSKQEWVRSTKHRHRQQKQQWSRRQAVVESRAPPAGRMDPEQEPLLRVTPDKPAAVVKLHRCRAYAFVGVILIVILSVVYFLATGDAYTDAEDFGRAIKHLDFLLLTLVVFLVILVCEAAGVPSTLLCITAAYVYATKLDKNEGFWVSLVVSYSGSVAGATVALGLGRTVLKEWAEELIAGNRVMRAVKIAVTENQWRVNLLLRLSPIPDAFTNYGLAISDTSLPAFLMGTAGLIPWVALDSYVGSTLSSLSDIEHTTTWEYVAYVLMIVALGCFIWLLTVWARRALMEMVEKTEAGAGAKLKQPESPP